MRSRVRALVLVAVSATALSFVAASVLAAPSKPAIVRDAKGDVGGKLDLQRLKLGLAANGRLRAVVTFAGKVTPADLFVKRGPPGSVCLRVWTAANADPTATRPDRLVCVTARTKNKLRAAVLRQNDPGLPKRVGRASVSASKSRRSLSVAITQRTLGRPARIRYALESTRPGCELASCIDTAPAAPATRRFRLR
jgi:hypothetical protein